MADVSWNDVAPFVEDAHAAHGDIERADVVDLAYAANVSDAVIDVLDAIGSRVFKTPQDVKEFFLSRSLISG